MKLFVQPHGEPRTAATPIAPRIHCAAKVLRSIFLLAAITASLFALSGCNDYGNTFQTPTGAPISFLAPSQASAGGPAFTITVSSPSGGFVAQTVVQWDGKTIPTTVVSATSVTATVSAALIAKPGTAFVNTLNPFSGTGQNGLSNTLSFLVNPPANPVPAVSSMSPKAATVGSPSFTLTVNGSNFISDSDPSKASQVRFNLGPTQTSLPILNITASQIQATVAASLLVNATTAPLTAIVTVYNPPAAGTPAGNGGVANPTSGGGGTSPGGLSFTVNPVGTPSNAAPRAEAEAAEDTPAVSADGRYVAYAATQGDHSQVFVRDTCEGADSGCQSHTTLLSAASDGTVGNDDSRSPSMSADGRYIAFSSAATNLASAKRILFDNDRRPPNLSARHLRRRQNAMLAHSATHLHRPVGRARRHRRYPALGQFLRPLRRVPRGYAKPLRFGIRLEPRRKIRRLHHIHFQQRLPPGLRSRHLHRRLVLHAKNNAHLAPARRHLIHPMQNPQAPH